MAIMHKFRAINKLNKDALENGQIYFAAPHELDDPVDCKVNILDCLNGVIATAKGQNLEILEKLRDEHKFIELITHNLSNIGVCSFASNLDNERMWDEYADHDRGMCLTYEIPEQFFTDHAGEILGIGLVEYGDDLLSEWFGSTAPEIITPFREFTTKFFIKLMTIKTLKWNYQVEGRIVSRKSGLYNLDKGFLKQVCFGSETSQNNKEEVKKLLEKSGYKVKIYERRIKPDGRVENVEIN